MSDNHIIVALIGLTALFAITKAVKGDVVENFMGMPQTQTAVEQVIIPRGGGNVNSALPQNFPAQFASTNTYGGQSMARDQLAMNDTNLIRMKEGYRSNEGYRSREGFQGCRGTQGVQGSMSQAALQQSKASGTSGLLASAIDLPPPDYTANNYQQLQNQQRAGVQVSNSLPIRTMANSPLGAALSDVQEGGMEVQPIIVDRFMFANTKSRLANQGDFFRGDLPIVPNCSDWFRPAARPQIDLRAGALAAMGGIDNSTGQELLALRTAAAGGALDVGQGINYAVNRSAFAGAAQGDIKYASFI